jgi:hypothetical protein
MIRFSPERLKDAERFQPRSMADQNSRITTSTVEKGAVQKQERDIYLAFLAWCLIHSFDIQNHVEGFVVMRNESPKSIKIKAVFYEFPIHLYTRKIGSAVRTQSFTEDIQRSEQVIQGGKLLIHSKITLPSTYTRDCTNICGQFSTHLAEKFMALPATKPPNPTVLCIII